MSATKCPILSDLIFPKRIIAALLFKNFTAVKNINFHIDYGQTLGVLGPNGCGKTTTIGMLLGLIKPSNGKILIDDENFENLNREKILSQFNLASP